MQPIIGGFWYGLYAADDRGILAGKYGYNLADDWGAVYDT